MPIIRDLEALTPAVLEVMAQTKEPRLREIMESLVQHLHGFVRETGLTEEEFRAATAILNTMGQQTTDSHNEFVLMAGSLGVSSLVCLQNNGDGGTTETTQSLLGPFWRLNHPETAQGASIVRSSTPGPAMFVEFAFTDAEGAPVEGLEVDVWHASPVGLYENQDADQAPYNLRGKFRTGTDGMVHFRSVRPIGYPIPTDTTVGRLLEAQGRHPMRPAHVHVLAFKEGFKTLISQIYVDDTEWLTSDVQFGVTEALIGKLERHEGPHPEADGPDEWFSLSHRFALQEGEARLPVPPIK
ncbi:dioxygenase family protein [Vannielia sp. SX4]|uniref:dioxygenase family protein n=1 Tax=Vannielia sp. SX4 TaxID=3463852 RepID=UPI004058E772